MQSSDSALGKNIHVDKWAQKISVLHLNTIHVNEHVANYQKTIFPNTSRGAEKNHEYIYRKPWKEINEKCHLQKKV
jgi:hypothetical protein